MRRLLRALGFVVLGLLVILAVGPYLVPLPAQPDRDAAAVAAELGLDGRFITVDGTRTFIQEAGLAGGPAVVLIHGFGGSTFSWRLTLPALARAGYRAVALDLRDFGLSDKSWEADTSHGAQARFVLGVMDALGIGHAVIVGHSMGADVAVHLAMGAPDRVAALVLVDAATGDGRSGTMGGPLGALAPILLALPPVRRLAQQVLRRVITPERLNEILASAYLDPATLTPGIRAGYGGQVQTRDWDLALLAVTRDGTRSGLPLPLSSVTAPTLVIWGAEDPWVPISAGKAIRDAIPGAGWAVVPGAGHLPFEEQPDAFLADLLPFLEAHR
jgi:pimeloyl-ACP methyl ester carboxylesterase